MNGPRKDRFTFWLAVVYCALFTAAGVKLLTLHARVGWVYLAGALGVWFVYLLALRFLQ